MRAPGPALQPRLLTADVAAGYMGMGVKAFVRLGLGRVPLGARVRYDRLALDAHLDALSGLAPQSPPAAPRAGAANDHDDPEAAFDRYQARSR